MSQFTVGATVPKTATKSNKKSVPSQSKEDRRRAAIHEHFGNPDGTIYVKPITEHCFRVNWYRDHKIVLSKFVRVEEVGDGVIVEDKTQAKREYRPFYLKED